MNGCLHCKEQERIGELYKLGIEHRVQLLDELVIRRKRVTELEQAMKAAPWMAEASKAANWARQASDAEAKADRLAVSFDHLLHEYKLVCHTNARAVRVFESAEAWLKDKYGVWSAP